MNLYYDERFMLALYLEYFGREYNVHDERELKLRFLSNELMRYVEMENVVFLVNQMGVKVGDYDFSYNIGPYSPGLLKDLYVLDKKEDLIDEFYEDYNETREKCYATYEIQLERLLSDYCEEDATRKIAVSSYALQEFLHRKNGSIIIGMMIYLYKTIYSYSSKGTIQIELINRFQNMGIDVVADWGLLDRIWKELSTLGIIKKEPKSSIRREKTLTMGYINRISGKN